MYKHYIAAILSLAWTSMATAQGFDWSLLHGQWAESTRFQFGCRQDNLHHQFVVSADKKSITFKLDRLWKIGTGKKVREYTASIQSAKENALVIRYGPELQGLSDELREWELRFIGPSTYRWRATAWPENQYNEVVGVKCKQ